MECGSNRNRWKGNVVIVIVVVIRAVGIGKAQFHLHESKNSVEKILQCNVL